jgi:anti-sigma regulatory factor (Ser/Thr protein kinase)
MAFTDEPLFDARSVASELINNAYRHGEGMIEPIVKRFKRYMRIEVGDEGPTARCGGHEAKGDAVVDRVLADRGRVG